MWLYQLLFPEKKNPQIKEIDGTPFIISKDLSLN